MTGGRERRRIRAGIRPAGSNDLDGIMAIEEASFQTPWPRSAMASEMEHNSFSRTVVAVVDGEVLAFMVYWLVVDEIHLQNIATAPASRGAGLARRLLAHLLREAEVRECTLITLEVREGNAAARGLYESFGFAPTGRRRRYYTDSGEDAILMTLRIEDRAASPAERLVE